MTDPILLKGRGSIAVAGLALLLATPALAASPIQTLIGTVGPPAADGATPVELVVVNGGDETTFLVPDRVTTQVVIDGTARTVSVERVADQARSVALPSGGFVRTRYVLRPAPTEPRVAQAAATPPPDTQHGFFDNFSAYNAMYAVYGPSETTDTRLQLSLKYQLFGRGGDTGPGSPWLNRIYLGYTQRMFADLGEQSNPFRNIDFIPEVFYLVAPRPIGEGVTLGGQAGLRHESNGRAGATSRSLNTIYAQPVVGFRLGDLPVEVGPRVWVYFGSRDDNPRIAHYRGNTGLYVRIGDAEGLQLTANSRLNPGSGKGAIDAELSYPLTRLVASNLNLYVFGQAFAGYGENLLDYDRHQARIRFGFGIVR